MRLGCCLTFSGSDDDIARLRLLAEVGYQYVEPTTACLRMRDEPSAYYMIRRAFNRAPLVPEAVRLIMPDDLPVIGDAVDWGAVEKHVAMALDRIEEIGGKTVCISEDSNLGVLEDYPEDDALSQLRYLLNMAADYAGSMAIALGPISPDPAYPLAGLAERAEFVRQVGRAEVRLMAGALGHGSQASCVEYIARSGDLLHHVHCAAPRSAQEDGDGPVSALMGALSALQYEGRLSVCLPAPDLDEGAGTAIADIRQCAQRKK